ncbi:MAG: hypothetical protein EXR62_12980 [Chloroflexi bacterium]|nr:hypothetical protein [Chloroflexota bacterium]
METGLVNINLDSHSKEGQNILNVIQKAANVLRVRNSTWVEFEGRRIAEVGSFGDVECVEIWQTGMGFLLYVYHLDGHHQAYFSTTLFQLLDTIAGEHELLGHLRTVLIRKGWLPEGGYI